eukprot:CAMPEP_0182461662 /NCGR_PEP_ID=MMETSP1319-20130603/6175_1 /TAXON_ID=172717 /ORGANISM="Bolidomonas pacifica, Strain RCC208" /LENGTH=165 /DNA_ID=CAMNT_0024660977 /DNA_START=35 /DNA_END=532 /DNA_ORIENTATION=-
MSVSKRLKRIVFTEEEKAGTAVSKTRSSSRRRSRASRRRAADEEAETFRQVMTRVSDTEDIDEIVELTRHEDARVRQAALEQMCPCHVQDDIEDFWTRVIEMASDPSTAVRKQVLHTLCDGSPVERETEIVEALATFNTDDDREIRRIAHKVLASYSRTGRWNIL